MAQWHCMEKEPPKKPGYYQVAVEAYVTLTNQYLNKDGKEHLKKFGDNFPAVCYWNGEIWESDEDTSLLLDCTDGSRLIKTDTIYAWADVFLPDVPETLYPSEPITINPADYHLTEGQLKNFLQDYKRNYEKNNQEEI